MFEKSGGIPVFKWLKLNEPWMNLKMLFSYYIILQKIGCNQARIKRRQGHPDSHPPSPTAGPKINYMYVQLVIQHFGTPVGCVPQELGFWTCDW